MHHRARSRRTEEGAGREVTDFDDIDLDAVLTDVAEKTAIESILGCAIRRPDTMTMLRGWGMAPEDLDHPKHRHIWAVAERRAASGKPLDFKAVEIELVADGMDADDAKAFVAATMRESVDIESPSLVDHVAGLKQRVSLRRVGMLRALISTELGKEGATAAGIQALVTREFDRIVRGVTPSKAITGEELKRLALRRFNPEAPVLAMRTGISAIDDNIGGIPRGGFIVIAAPPKVGKTSVAKRLTITAATNGERVLYVSIEPQAHEFAEGVTEQLAGVKLPPDINSLRHFDRDAYIEATDVTASMPWFFERLVLPSVEEVTALIHSNVSRHGITFVIVDHVSYIAEPSLRMFGSMERAHAHIAKQMAACVARLPNVASCFFSQHKGTDEASEAKSGRDPIPHTREWARFAYLVGDLYRNEQAQDPKIRNLVRYRTRIDRVSGTPAQCHFLYNPRTARLDPAYESGELIDA